jgi:FAD:protein FMN transferase
MLTRRRFLSIVAAAGTLPSVPFSSLMASTIKPVVWRGVAMGGTASMVLAHPDRAAGKQLVARCVAEIARLEAIFSIYRPDTALVRLNAAGVLNDPPLELVEILSFATALARHTDGSFDPTVQPLFKLYAEHFAIPDACPEGPPPDRIAETLELVDHRLIEVSTDRIRLHRAGMGVTLNGIAQGYITDRVATLLRTEGLENMLLDLGEIHAAGLHPDGRAWRAGIADPAAPRKTLLELDLPNRPHGLPALATSGGYGLHFDPAGRHHHLLDPATGQSADEYASVSVTAPNAMLADGLSTALATASATRRDRILGSYAPVRAYFVDTEGRIEMLPRST